MKIEILNEASMSRIYQHLKTDYVGCITSFITGNNPNRIVTNKARSHKENKKANKKLSADLQKLGYGFVRVTGYYQEEGSISPDKEESYFVICPKGISFENFAKSLVALARKYEQESIVVWNTRQGWMLATDDFKEYKRVMTFNSFSIDKIREVAWTQFNNNWFMFNQRTDTNWGKDRRKKRPGNANKFRRENYILESVSDYSTPANNPSSLRYSALYRDELINDYDTGTDILAGFDGYVDYIPDYSYILDNTNTRNYSLFRSIYGSTEITAKQIDYNATIELLFGYRGNTILAIRTVLLPEGIWQIRIETSYHKWAFEYSTRESMEGDFNSILASIFNRGEFDTMKPIDEAGLFLDGLLQAILN